MNDLEDAMASLERDRAAAPGEPTLSELFRDSIIDSARRIREYRDHIEKHRAELANMEANLRKYERLQEWLVEHAPKLQLKD